jgi:hypothetical protein
MDELALFPINIGDIKPQNLEAVQDLVAICCGLGLIEINILEVQQAQLPQRPGQSNHCRQKSRQYYIPNGETLETVVKFSLATIVMKPENKTLQARKLFETVKRVP